MRQVSELESSYFRSNCNDTHNAKVQTGQPNLICEITLKLALCWLAVNSMSSMKGLLRYDSGTC
jgi:hypothetical protein